MTLCILSHHCEIKPKIDSKQISSKYTKSWTLNNLTQNAEWVKGEVKNERKYFLEIDELVSIAHLWDI